MVAAWGHGWHLPCVVSVLALSSRFDGLVTNDGCVITTCEFQYSLCRVVLMVPSPCNDIPNGSRFQYSLCRVVLMVFSGCPLSTSTTSVSVLALSSRFDGPHLLRAADP